MMGNDTLLLWMFAGVIVLGAALLVVMALVKKAPKSIDKEKFQADWLAIENNLEDSQASLQMAILRADSLLDRALKARGFKGETMGERMGAAGRIFSKSDLVWSAHKLRNKIAHEEGPRLSVKLVKRVLASFKQALKDVGAL